MFHLVCVCMFVVVGGELGMHHRVLGVLSIVLVGGLDISVVVCSRSHPALPSTLHHPFPNPFPLLHLLPVLSIPIIGLHIKIWFGHRKIGLDYKELGLDIKM